MNYKHIVPVTTRDEETARQREEFGMSPIAAKATWAAFYSSDLGGITTDRSLMVVPVDDHMVHRGHSVFDTSNISHGSAELARIQHDYTKPYLKTIIMRLAAVSGLHDHGMIKMWLSAGRGDFNISPRDLHGATFYAVAIEYHGKSSVAETGVSEVVVTSVPMKPCLLATLKSTNYLINALVCMDAQDRGGYLGIQARVGDDDGELYVAESPISNVGFFKQLHDDDDKNDDDDNKRKTKIEFVTPNETGILDGTTLKRAISIMNNCSSSCVDDCGFVFVVTRRNVKVSELAQAKEIVGFGGGFLYPVVKLNGVDVNDGKVGNVFKWLNNKMVKEFENEAFTDVIEYEEARVEKVNSKLIGIVLVGIGCLLSSLFR